MKIGCVNSDNYNLKGGPKSFMNRLRDKLIERELYTEDIDNMDKFIALSFTKVPKKIKEKKNIQIITRFDGIRNWSLLPPCKVFNPFRWIEIKLLNHQIKKNLSIADKLIFQSEFSKEQNINLLGKNINLLKNKENIIIHNGVELCKKTIEHNYQTENILNILILHRFHPMKRAIQIPEILAELRKEKINFKAHFVGSGVFNPYTPFNDSLVKIKKKVDMMNLSRNVIFHGHLDHDELADILETCDIMLNLSFSDPCPNAVIEAQNYGLPVVAPNNGGIPEICANKELLVDERITMNKIWPIYFDAALPKIYVKEYSEKIKLCMSNYSILKRRSLEFIDSNHRLDDIVDKYIAFIVSESRYKR